MSTFTEAEKLVRLDLTEAEREQAAASRFLGLGWRGARGPAVGRH
jgi:hypothetical protein